MLALPVPMFRLPSAAAFAAHDQGKASSETFQTNWNAMNTCFATHAIACSMYDACMGNCLNASVYCEAQLRISITHTALQFATGYLQAAHEDQDLTRLPQPQSNNGSSLPLLMTAAISSSPFSFYLFLFFSLSFFPLYLSLFSLHWVFWVWMDLPTSFSQSKRIQGEKLASLLQRWHASAVQLMSFCNKNVAIDPQIVYFGWPLHSKTNLWEKGIIRTSMISAHVVSCLHRHARWTNTRGARRMLYARAAHGRYPPQTTTPRMHGWTKMTSLFIRFIQFKILKFGLSTTAGTVMPPIKTSW